MDKEIWKDVEGYEGYYQVSNLGRFKSFPKEMTLPHGYKFMTPERILSGTVNWAGYINISLRVYKPKVAKLHRLVAQAFIPNTENKPHINHINGIKTDNRVDNLEWCTPKENVNHAIDNGLFQPITMAKLTESDIVKICELLDNGVKCVDIAKMYGVTKSALTKIKNGGTWSKITGNKLDNDTKKTKLSKNNVLEILELLKDKNLKRKDIAEKFNISRETLWQINKGKIWTELTRN